MQYGWSTCNVALVTMLLIMGSVWPSFASADLYVCADNEVRVFADNAQGLDEPIRVIGGVNTGITECNDVALDASNGEIWVATGNLEVFSSTASGDVLPSRHIDQLPTFAVSVAVYGNEVMTGGPGGVIATYDRLATGTAVPLRQMDVSAVIGTAASIFIDRTRNEVYASDSLGGGVAYAFARTQTGIASPTAGPWPASSSRGLFFDPTADLLYVAGSAGVTVFRHDGSVQGQLPSAEGQLFSPWGLAVTKGGQLIVSGQAAQPTSADPIKFFSPFPAFVATGTLYGGAALGRRTHGVASSDARACGWGHSVDDCVLRDGFEGGIAHSQ